MKFSNTFLFILAIVVTNFCFGQDSFIDESKKWLIAVESNTETVDYRRISVDDYLFFFEGEKVLDGKVYQVLKRQNAYHFYAVDFNGEVNWDENHGNTELVEVGYFREDLDAQKVFIHTSSNLALSCQKKLELQHQDSLAHDWEELLLDFSLINDEHLYQAVFPSSRYHAEVASIYPVNDYFNWDPEYQPEGVVLENLPDRNSYTTLMDGVGFKASAFYPLQECWKGNEEVKFNILCYSKGDSTYRFENRSIVAQELVYPEPNGHGCRLSEKLGITTKLNEGAMLNVVNPVRNAELEFRHPISGHISVRSMDGKELMSTYLEHAKKLPLITSSPGVYLVQLRDEGNGIEYQKVVVK